MQLQSMTDDDAVRIDAVAAGFMSEVSRLFTPVADALRPIVRRWRFDDPHLLQLRLTTRSRAAQRWNRKRRRR